jgi:hypothetical protein
MQKQGLYKPKRKLVDEGTGWGIVLWRLPDGSYVMNGQDYLSAGPCEVGNVQAEINMRRAAASLGITQGQPFWLPGFRKVSDSEWEDQMERLMDGKIPDPVDLYLQNGDK